MEQNRYIMFYAKGLPNLPAGARPTVTAKFCANWLPDNHLVYLVSDVVDQLDLSAMHAVYEEGEARATAVRSTTDDEVVGVRLLHGSVQLAEDSEAVCRRTFRSKVLTAGNEPDFRTISDYRKIHIETLQNLFEQVLAMALECGAIKAGPGIAGRGRS